LWHTGEAAAAGSTKLQAVILYEHENRGGAKLPLLVEENCKNLPQDWKDHASSVELRSTCVILFSGESCKGRAIRLEPNDLGTWNLNAVDFNDITQSLQEC